MSVLKELQNALREDFDRQLSVSGEYVKASEALHRFIEDELPPDKLDRMETLIINVNNAMFHSAIETGMKYGAKLTAELLK